MSDIKININHEHKYGITYGKAIVPESANIETGTYSIDNAEDITDDMKKIMELTEIEFEPEKGEFLSFEIDDDDITVIITESDLRAGN